MSTEGFAFDSFDINDPNTAPEELPSLEEVADEAGGAWPQGWYSATVIDGYATPKGTQFQTGDEVSKKGDSRNMQLCLRVSNGKEERTMRVSFNYRLTDFKRLAEIVQARKDFAGVRGKWVGAEDLQRSSLAMGKLGQLEKSTGFKPKLRPDRQGLDTSIYMGQQIDVRLSIGESGYNEVTAVAKSGTKGKKK